MTKENPQAESETAEKAVETETPVNSKAADINACITHGREIMDTQLSLVAEKQYDFAPEFNEMTAQLYLLGVVWKFAEGLDTIAKDARENAFLVIQTMLISDGMKLKDAQKRIEFLRKMSQLDDGSDALAVDIGRESIPDDNSLVEVFEHYVDDFQVSGEFWRLYDRGKKTMLYGGLSVAFIVIWFVTLYMPGNTTIAILAAGLIAAALFVIPTFLIGLVIYRQKMKKAKQSSSS